MMMVPRSQNNAILQLSGTLHTIDSTCILFSLHAGMATGNTLRMIVAA